MIKRIAAAGEHFAIAGWREDAGFLLFHFPTWAKARAMQHWIDRSAIAHRAHADLLQRAAARRRQRLLLRCRRPPLSRQKDQALVVRATLYETGPLGVADRFLEVRALTTDGTTDAFGSPPRIRVPDTEVVELGDECRHTLETVLVDHPPMVPQRHAACQH